MQPFSPSIGRVAILTAIILVAGAPTWAANYPLEITNIGPAGTRDLSATSRIYRAYPELEYNIRAAVVGGAYPYTFALTNAPAGMTIDGRGVITWAQPTADASPTIIVRDSEGSQVTSSWTIDVNPAGFRFIDSINGRAAPTGAGTLSNPWRTMADAYYNAEPTDILYFRTGTYNQLSLPRSGIGDTWERVEWEADERPVIWLAYPGESPVINFGYRAGVEPGPMIRINGVAGHPPYVDGFETTNTGILGFQTASAATFRRLRMHDLLRGGESTNASFIMSTSGALRTGMVIQDSEFYNISSSAIAVTIKIYSQLKLLIEDTSHHDVDVAIELKNSASQYTVRSNRFYNVRSQSLGGNMQATYGRTYGEVCFNNIAGNNVALVVNQNSEAGTTHVYRNTLRGRVSMWNVTSEDGPFLLSNNVIVNSDSGVPSGSHVYHDAVTAPARIVLSNNLVGYPSNNIVDSSGRLTTAYASYLGTHGYELVGGAQAEPAVPRAPVNVTIIR